MAKVLENSIRTTSTRKRALHEEFMDSNYFTFHLIWPLAASVVLLLSGHPWTPVAGAYVTYCFAR
ncbi:MAG TPA: hypothetical protein VLT36_05580 [Candidatus Dormibacteraeota bacterium]|nr:hypothetical protein [Candidatus Dormibacteraeota bacterium]